MEDGAIFSHYVQMGPVSLKACDGDMQRSLAGKLCRQIMQCMLDSLGQHSCSVAVLGGGENSCVSEQPEIIISDTRIEQAAAFLCMANLRPLPQWGDFMLSLGNIKCPSWNMPMGDDPYNVTVLF
jgi:hypothetical protein